MAWHTNIPMTYDRNRHFKNVLVLAAPDHPSSFIAEQPVHSREAGRLDSCELFKDIPYFMGTHELEESKKEQILRDMSTPDGILFFNFRNKIVTPHPRDRKSIEPYIDHLQDRLQARGETLDAIVLCTNKGRAKDGSYDYENAETIDWLKRMKARFPDVAILADGYTPHAFAGHEKTKHGFAYASHPDSHSHEQGRREVIIPGHQDYALAEPVHAMLVNVFNSDKANELRIFMNMPLYKGLSNERLIEPKKGKSDVVER